MSLLDRVRKQPAIDGAEVKEIQERVKAMREQIGRREVELTDLFSLLREDERPALRDMHDVARPEIARVWPDQVPSRTPTADLPASRTTTYGDWELMRRKGLITRP